jgi:uncharacterized membrane protein
MRKIDHAPNRINPVIPVATPRLAEAIYSILASFPVAFFTGALATDLAYLKTAEMMWADFSAWLLFAGLIFGGLAAIVALINFFSHPLARRLHLAWLRMIVSFLVLVFAFANSLIHSRDAWTSVVPTGVILSAVTVLLMIFAVWIGWYRFREEPCDEH